jgi:hypothetical protein
LANARFQEAVRGQRQQLAERRYSGSRGKPNPELRGISPFARPGVFCTFFVPIRKKHLAFPPSA